MNLYETDQYLNEYLFFHYGRPGEFCPYPFAPKEALQFQTRILRECLRPVRFQGPTRGLDVGCAVGRLTFELARYVDHAVGVDNSRNFIRAAQQMARQHSRRISVKEEGDLFSDATVTLPRNLQTRKVDFRVGDAQDLGRLQGKPFHIVTAINLIDRLPQPRKFLKQLSGLVLPRGQLVIGSPYTWMEAFTPKREWLGGRNVRGKSNFTSDALRSHLGKHFKLVGRCDLPFLIREHRRKYQWCVSEISTFERLSTPSAKPDSHEGNAV